MSVCTRRCYYNINRYSWRLCTHFEEIDDHVPLSAVADEIATKEIDETIIEREVCVLKRELKVIIRLVELVVEEQVGLYNLYVRLGQIKKKGSQKLTCDN